MRFYPPRPTGPHTGWSPTRNRTLQRKFREALLRRSGGVCEYPQCQRTHGLEAHHDKAGYTPDCGRLLCGEHHEQVDPHARPLRRSPMQGETKR